MVAWLACVLCSFVLPPSCLVWYAWSLAGRGLLCDVVRLLLVQIGGDVCMSVHETRLMGLYVSAPMDAWC